MTDPKPVLENAHAAMEKVHQHAQIELAKVRAGKASPALLQDLKVSCYGSVMPLHQLAAVNTPDARSLTIKPFDKGMIAEVEKAILNSDLGLNPQNDGETIRIHVPALSQERRMELVKHLRHEAEMCRVGVRNVRKEYKERLKALETSEDSIRQAEDKLQKLTDDTIALIDSLLAGKEKDILTV